MGIRLDRVYVRSDVVRSWATSISKLGRQEKKDAKVDNSFKMSVLFHARAEKVPATDRYKNIFTLIKFGYNRDIRVLGFYYRLSENSRSLSN